MEKEMEVEIMQELLDPKLASRMGAHDPANDANKLLLCSKKKKAKRKKSAVPEEVKKLATQMSKKKRKKLEQLKQRKEKATRRSQLVATLKSTELQPNQLDLLQSSKVLNPHLSSGQLATLALKKQRAGLKLSAEEESALFRGSGNPKDNGNSQETMNTSNQLHEETRKEKTKQAQGTVKGQSCKPVSVVADRNASQIDDEGSASSDSTSEEEQTVRKDEQVLSFFNKEKKTDVQKQNKQALLASLDEQMSNMAPKPETLKTTDNSKSNQDVGLNKPQLNQDANGDKGESAASNIMKQLAALKNSLSKNKPTMKSDIDSQTNNTPKLSSTSDGNSKRPAYVPVELSLPSGAEVCPGLGGLGQHEVNIAKCEMVVRNPELQVARLQLPVCGMEQEIVEAINENSVIILCGETGSGKSTQVPQFLYEAGYCRRGMIGATQPRRVAAVSTAYRVAQEMGTKCGLGGYVAYQIRYDSAGVTKNTRMKFMTDGILLQEISQDLLLRKYSVIILDEAHERNLNTDVLLGLLSRSIPLRKKAAANEEGIHPLKLVIMSATLRVEDFTNNRVLFPNPPPVVKVSARQYPVTVHFNKRTEIHDYLGETFKKACKVHSRLPEGGILIFLTGQREILYMCNKLEQEFNNKIPKTSRSHECQHEKRALDDNQQTPGSESYIDDLDVMEEDAEIVHQEASGDDEASSDGEEVESDFDEKDPDLESEVTVGPVHVLPLFAMLPPEQQSKVFKDPPAGHRLIVVATNVAETSVTIPGIKYVIDCGRAKSRVLHHETGISQFQVGWVSQASADQRAGRAGRTGPGHCYRLYSTAVYLQQFEKFAEPEVKTRALEDVVLQMKAMGIPDVEKFPFPTAPDPKPLHAAVTLLQNLGAVNKNNKQITALGRAMAALPIGARFSKMVLVSQHYGLVDYALALVATISERDPFVNPIKTPIKTETTTDAAKQEEETLLEMREKERLREVRSGWLHPTSDGLARLKAIGAYAYATNGGTSSGHQFCKDNLLHQPTMDRALQLRKQLARLVDFKLKNNLRRTEQGGHLTQLQPPDQDTEDDLKQILLSGLLDCVAKRAPVGTITEGGKHRRKAAYLSCNPAISEPLYIHPDSSLYTKEPEFLPQWVCYHSVTRSQGSDMVYMVCVTSIDPSWLVGLGEGSPLLTLSDPLTSPSPVYDKEKDILCCYVMPRFGVHNWELGAHQVPMITTSATEDFCARWLARLLLEGKIVPVLKDLMAKKMLNDSPAHITLKKPKKKVVLLVSTLLEHRIICPRDLQEKWQKNKMFLFNYLSMWIKEKNLQDWKRVWNSIEM